MEIPEKVSEALNQTQSTMKTFRKSMLLLLFEWQNLETRLDLTQKCFQETFPLQESAPESSTELSEVEKDRDFIKFQENGFREMEKREEKLGVLRKEICLREKRVFEQEGLIDMERKLIGEKEKRVQDCLREIEVKEEEFGERVREFQVKEKELEVLRKDLEFREKELNSREKLNPVRESAVFRITGPSNQSMTLVNASEMGSGNQKLEMVKKDIVKEKLNPQRGSAGFRRAGPSNQSMAIVNGSETSSINQQISKGRLRSKAWLHFTKIAKGVGSNDKCKCNHCHRIFTLCGGSTSQLLRHISEGRCSAFQKRNSTLRIDEMLSETHSGQFVDVQVEEALAGPSNVGEDSRTPLIKGCEESVKQEPATVLLEPELQTQPNMEPQMAIPNNSEYNYQPQQLNELSKDQSDPSFDSQPLEMGNSGIPPPLNGYSVSLENSEYLMGMEDSTRYSQETQLEQNKGSSDTNENALGHTSEELQMFTCEVEKPCCSGDQKSQNRKREREHGIEQNESSNVFHHSDIEDLSSPLRKHCPSKLSACDNENTEDVLHEVDPISCIMPIDPAQELYGNMMNQNDIIHEGSIPE